MAALINAFIYSSCLWFYAFFPGGIVVVIFINVTFSDARWLDFPKGVLHNTKASTSLAFGSVSESVWASAPQPELLHF